MPIHEYRCEACSEQFEVIQRLADPPLDTCRKCGKGPVIRLLSSPAIQFKGSGWYITDYARKGSSESKTGAPESGKAEAKGDTPASESKPAEAKPASPAKADAKTT